jgi:hypothetical protein
MLPNYISADNMKEMFALISYLCMQSPNADLLSSALKYTKLPLSPPIKRWHLNFFAIAKAGERLEAKVYSYLRNNLTLVRLSDLHGNINIPPPSIVTRQIPRFGYSVIWYFSFVPYGIFSFIKNEIISIKYHAFLEARKGNPSKAVLIGPKFWGFRKNIISGFNKFLANRTNAIRLYSQQYAASDTKINKVKCRWASTFGARLMATICFFINFATIIPDIVHCVSLRHKRPLCGGISVLDTISICEKHGASRSTVSAVDWFIRCKALARFAPLLSIKDDLMSVNNKFELCSEKI